MKAYIPRVVDAEISAALAAAGAVVLKGARAVGKTESARQFARSEIRLDSADARASLAREQPSTALDGDVPRLLDEWQLVPALWNEVRRAVDDRRVAGQFLLSGSATPDDDILRHSGAGRFHQVQMRTMTFLETRHSAGAVSLAGLLGGDVCPIAESELDFRATVRRIVIGGWPGWSGDDESAARARAAAYLSDIVEHEFSQVAGPRRDPRRLLAHLRAVAAMTAQPAGYAAITRRTADESAVAGVSPAATVQAHEFAERLFLVEDQPAWSPKLRSATAATQTPKRHLVDPSLAAALLGAGPDRLLSEPETLGFLFESAVVHDLRVYAQSIGARGVFHYRDVKGRDEVDAIVEGSEGSYLAIEVKLGPGAVDAAAANLSRVTAKFAKPPIACVVIIPTGVAHTRPDGVHVVPLSVLGP